MRLDKFVSRHGLQAVMRRVIIVRGEHWRVEAITGHGLRVRTGWRANEGLIPKIMWDRCRVLPRAYELTTRYPRLIRSLVERHGIGKEDARQLLIGYIANGSFYRNPLDRLSHLGPAADLINRCWEQRHQPTPVYLIGDEVMTCPRCGSRTEFDELPNGRQRHYCLFSSCGYEFYAEHQDHEHAA
jgi:hypothetical protein